MLQTTLCLAAAAVVINIWLAIRCGQTRAALKIGVGDGGNPQMIRRMRAQSNFIEQTPLTLLLFALVESAGKGGMWLAPVGAVFLLGRVAHAFGMEENGFKPGRPIGMLTAMLTQIVLVVVAVGTAMGRV